MLTLADFDAECPVCGQRVNQLDRLNSVVDATPNSYSPNPYSIPVLVCATIPLWVAAPCGHQWTGEAKVDVNEYTIQWPGRMQ